MSRAVKIVALGGGNGLSMVLRGLTRRRLRHEDLELTAVVATADDGGSSGRLRRELGGAPVGDIRNCLLAMAPEGAALTDLMAHRFGGNGSLGGHSLGNLVLTALVDRSGSLTEAVAAAGALLGVRDRVLPVTEDEVRLRGVDSGGNGIDGESNIGRSSCAMHAVTLDPSEPRPTSDALAAIEACDALVIGPGSLFTSLLPVLLVPGVVDAVRRVPRRILVANLMTQPGETLGLDFGDHIDALDRHVGPALVDDIVVHSDPIAPPRLDRYEAVGAVPVDVPVAWRGPQRMVRSDLLTGCGKIRHDPDRLAEVIVRLAVEPRPTVGASPVGDEGDGR